MHLLIGHEHISEKVPVYCFIKSFILNDEKIIRKLVEKKREMRILRQTEVNIIFISIMYFYIAKQTLKTCPHHCSAGVC